MIHLIATTAIQTLTVLGVLAVVATLGSLYVAAKLTSTHDRIEAIREGMSR